MKCLHETKLFLLLDKLTDSQLEELEGYGAYVGVRESVQRAFGLFRRRVVAHLNKEEFFNLCYPDPAFEFSTNRFQSLLNAALKVTYEFLALQEIREAPEKCYQVALKWVGEKEWDLEVLDLSKKLLKFTEKGPESHEQYLLTYLVEENVLEVQQRLGRSNWEDHLRRSWHKMEQFFMVESLRYQCLVLDRKLNGYAVPEDLALPDIFLELLLHRHPADSSPLIRMYAQLWEMLQEPNAQARFEAAHNYMA